MDFIVYYNEKKYNINDYLDKHPGGSRILKKFQNKDMTVAFNKQNHSEYAIKTLNKYIVENNEDSIKLNIHKTTTLHNIKNKLFTIEDKYFIHKVLGLLSIISFIYRYFYILPIYNNLGFTGTFFDYATLFIHMLLSTSSLIFEVLEKRIISQPLIIYEEYRLHAIVFTLRSIIISILGMYNITYNYIYIYTILIIHLIVDIITYKYGTTGITAVRVDNNHNLILKSIERVFSYYQFLAIGSHLFFNEKIADLGFNTLIAIQSSAFLMTLRRKNLIKWYYYLFWYGLSLILSMYYMFIVKGSFFFIEIFIVFLLRITFNINKYILWSSYIIYNFYFQ